MKRESTGSVSNGFSHQSDGKLHPRFSRESSGGDALRPYPLAMVSGSLYNIALIRAIPRSSIVSSWRLKVEMRSGSRSGLASGAVVSDLKRKSGRSPTREQFRIAHFAVDFDGRVIETEERWRETIVELFLTAAVELGAFFAAAPVEPGWKVNRNNRLWADAATESVHFLRGRLWQGLPSSSVWMSWFGRPYRDLWTRHCNLSK